VSVGFDGQSAGPLQLIARVFPSKLLANQFFGAITLGRRAQQNAAAFR
jgi:hypothetical protein